MKSKIMMNPNPLVQYLGKLPEEFTLEDLVLYIEDHKIEMLNLRYAGEDGRLKTLTFVINNREHLLDVLTMGERIDGSSLFSHIKPGSSDLYVVPQYKTAFVNPFNEIPTLDILCSYYDKNGNPLESAPEYILQKAHDLLKEKTGYEFHAMGELEFYIISDNDPLYEAVDQRGYHESSPFNKSDAFRHEVMLAIAQAGGMLKYGHSEVGNFTIGKTLYEQNELEFLPCPVIDAAHQLLVAKWIIRTLAHQYGVTATFAPKITVGKAGSGMHIHTKLMKDGVSQMTENGKLSDAAKKAIAGYLDLAPSLTAFGNMNPTSYFRLVPHQEAPTNICWGDRNRSVLVRVPLGWTGNTDMYLHANPQQKSSDHPDKDKQTVEFRCPDGSADVFLLLAGLVVAARHGFEMENNLEYAAKTYVDVNIFHEEHQDLVNKLKQLPISCAESANMLQQQAAIYAEGNVFPMPLLESLITRLRKFADAHLREQIAGDQQAMLDLVEKFFHCG
ncbi:MAG: glutamine synthetase family protein [Bacteroidales bacterium]|jgi:glutamine synthetase|nr:glutamine synthetase family protein [Bacteroidales bacterium]MDD3130661.1 glutamine synthetase family protein [Bacteroidales bacterium]MDD3526564.1 glutamine synthetase family protein [Bacteroidales bacterium]MDD4177557.1 glutamine synthetase family protein [Bacteroidales bacterium]MDD4741179.1 glutamine synthetase family protein [Bacteroidales bacterium]